MRNIGFMRTYPIAKVVRHSELYRTFVIEAPLEAEPGQFIMLWLPGGEEKPFTLSDCHDGRIEVTVHAVGPFTRRLMQLKEGELVGIRGPFGKGFSLLDNAFVVGGGCGIAPVRHLLRRLERTGLRFRACLGVRTATDLIFPEDYCNANWCSVTSDDGSVGRHGKVTMGLAEAMAEFKPERVFVCGPEPMMNAVRDLAWAQGVSVEVAMERYMKCGIGICGSCMVEGTHSRVCADGPVFLQAVPGKG